MITDAEQVRTANKQGAGVRVSELCRSFRSAGGDVAAVDSVSLTLEGSAVTALTGPSGSGKSTLLHLIGAIERADSGRIEVNGEEVTSMSRQELTRYRRRIGFVFQRFHLLPAATALDNVIAPVAPYKVAFDKVARGRELLDAVGLAGRERSLPSQLSGGQQQRVAIARALLSEPMLLLADEPTGSLDSTTGAEVMELLLTLNRERGTTLLIATHEAAVADKADRVIRLQDGVVTADSRPAPATA